MRVKNNTSNDNCNGLPPLQLIVPVIFLLVLLFSLTLHAAPADKKILIVYQKTQGYSLQLVDNLQKQFIENGYQSQKMQLASENKISTLELIKIKQQTIIVSIGSQVSKLLLDKNLQTPILSALIPRHIFKSLQAEHPTKKNWSSLLINQPLDRQFHLITAVLGKNQDTAVLLGPYTKDLNQSLSRASTKASHRINIEEIKTSEELAGSLNTLNHAADVLLTLPDPVVYNKKTIREILSSAYRNKLPIIGFSRSYVKAGAIAAIYSKPEQISQQIDDIIKNYFKNNQFENKKYYPNDFSVALNKNIARSLGIKLASSQSIIKQIKKAENN